MRTIVTFGGMLMTLFLLASAFTGNSVARIESNLGMSAATSASPTPTRAPAPPANVLSNDPFREPTIDEMLDAALGSNDVDCDGVRNVQDNCLLTYNPAQRDEDGDKIGDACEPDPYARSVRFLKCDPDGDGIIDENDNCPWACNPDQADKNRNGIGDVCDPAFPNSVPSLKACPKRKHVKIPAWLKRN